MKVFCFFLEIVYKTQPLTLSIEVMYYTDDIGIGLVLEGS